MRAGALAERGRNAGGGTSRAGARCGRGRNADGDTRPDEKHESEVQLGLWWVRQRVQWVL